MEPTDETLGEEQGFYNESRATWLKAHPGKFALVKGRRLLGVYDSPDEAYKQGLNQLGNVPMLVVQIVPEQPIARFPALQLGLIRADIQS